MGIYIEGMEAPKDGMLESERLPFTQGRSTVETKICGKGNPMSHMRQLPLLLSTCWKGKR